MLRSRLSQVVNYLRGTVQPLLMKHLPKLVLVPLGILMLPLILLILLLVLTQGSYTPRSTPTETSEQEQDS